MTFCGSIETSDSSMSTSCVRLYSGQRVVFQAAGRDDGDCPQLARTSTICRCQPRRRSTSPADRNERVTWLALLGTVAVGFCCLLPVVDSLGQESPDEFCQWETFNASCVDQPGHVILMTSARYGRMRFGRCMREDHGSVGCSADVMPQLDRKCSGRTTCHVTIPDATLHNVHPCPRELMPYLEASYACIPVRSWISTICDWMGGDQPFSRGQRSFLTNVGPSELVASSVDCPWLVRVPAGQRINVTAHFGPLATAAGDEASPSRDLSAPATTSGFGVTSSCSLSVVIVDGNRTATLTPPCGTDRHRDRQTYSSYSNDIKVYTVVGAVHDGGTGGGGGGELGTLGNFGGFLLHYQVFGCPDISGISQASISRTGDTAVIRCNLSGETYFLTCKDSVWKGELYNCTKAGVVGAFQSSSTYTYGLLIVIGIGVSLGVAVGVVLLFGIVVCLRRKQTERRPSKLRSSHSTTENPLLARYRDLSSLDVQRLNRTASPAQRVFFTPFTVNEQTNSAAFCFRFNISKPRTPVTGSFFTPFDGCRCSRLGCNRKALSADCRHHINNDDLSSLDHHAVDACSSADIDRVYGCGIGTGSNVSWSRTSFPPTPSSMDLTTTGDVGSVGAATCWTSYEDVVDCDGQHRATTTTPADPSTAFQMTNSRQGRCVHAHQTRRQTGATTTAAAESAAANCGSIYMSTLPPLPSELLDSDAAGVALCGSGGGGGVRYSCCSCSGCLNNAEQQRRSGCQFVSSSSTHPIYVKSQLPQTAAAACCSCRQTSSSRPASVDLLQRTDAARGAAVGGGGGAVCGGGTTGSGGKQRSRSGSRLAAHATAAAAAGADSHHAHHHDNSRPTNLPALPVAGETPAAGMDPQQQQDIDSKSPDFIIRRSATAAVTPANHRACRTNVVSS